MKRHLLVLFGITMLLTAVIVHSADDNSNQIPKEICQKFLKAMFNNDKEGIQAIIVPTDGAEILWQGEPLNKEQLKEAEDSLKSLVVTEISEGETVNLPNGKSFVVKKGMIGDDKKLVWIIIGGEKMPAPFWIIKLKGDWKIDAKPFISARKAAERVREQKKDKENKAPN